MKTQHKQHKNKNNNKNEPFTLLFRHRSEINKEPLTRNTGSENGEKSTDVASIDMSTDGNITTVDKQIHFVDECFILKIHQNTTQPIILTLLTFRDRNVNNVRIIG